ncbi:MAG: hydroxyacylglutathione hydrolase [Paracoccaceae bacterium]
MAIEIVTVPCRSDNYAYLVRDEGTGRVALVDAPEVAPIRRALDERGWQLSQIWVTHHHDDHTSGVAELREGAEVIGNTADRARLPALDREVSDGESFSFGETRVKVMDVSGHTIGHIAFLCEEDEAVFTADSLMAMGCGRVFEGTPEMMWGTLSKLGQLPESVMVYSGHNYGKKNAGFALSIEPGNEAARERSARIEAADETGEPIVPASIGEEKATNPFLRVKLDSVRRAVGMPDAEPVEVFAEVRRRRDGF